MQVIFELELLGGLWNCLGLTEWVPSITNMLWYSFSSSVGNKTKKRIKSSQHYPLVKIQLQCQKILGNHQLLREKILSIPDHISNQHSFPLNTEHMKCQHPEYAEGTHSKAWLLPDSLVSNEI